MLTIDSTLQSLPSLLKGEHVEILLCLLAIFPSVHRFLIYQLNQIDQICLILTEWKDFVKYKQGFSEIVVYGLSLSRTDSKGADSADVFPMRKH
jgi:hypothetical protein